MLNVHKLVGDHRVMGPVDDPLQWSGRLRGHLGRRLHRARLSSVYGILSRYLPHDNEVAWSTQRKRDLIAKSAGIRNGTLTPVRLGGLTA